jgi:hypothetical protein
MTTEDLVVDLARSGGRVDVLPPPGVRWVRWVMPTFVLLAVVATSGARPTIHEDLTRLPFLALAGVTLLTALAAAAAAFSLSVPNARRSAVVRAAPIVAGTLWVGLLAMLLADGGRPWARLASWPVHWACVAEIAGIGAMAGATLTGHLRKAAPLDPGWTAALAMLAGFAGAACAVQFVCPIDDPAHHLISHVLPAATFVAAGAALARTRLDWRRRPRTSPR